MGWPAARRELSERSSPAANLKVSAAARSSANGTSRMNAVTATPVASSDARANANEDPMAMVVRRHLRFGWFSLLVFLTLGLMLEALHGFKVQAYLNVMNETRRLMWTLAHAHGAMLGLAHLGFA